MHRLSSTGLATAFFRLYILDALAAGPIRPSALLIRAGAEKLPFATGAFSRALQSLLEGAHLGPAPHGAVALTAVGAAERMAERERWNRVIPTVARILGEIPTARPVPSLSESPRPRYGPNVAESYLDQVLIASLRERMAAARDGGRPFVLVLGSVNLEHASVAHQRAMVHRTIRATLGSTSTLFGSDVDSFRFGEAGVALLAPAAGKGSRAAELSALLRTRLDELIGTMTTSVRAFGGTRWDVSVGGATWSPEIVTSAALLRLAEDALAGDSAVTAA